LQNSYSVSDIALRKICKKLAAPLSPLGYWTKIAAGKKPLTPPLPKFAGATKIIRERLVRDAPVEPAPEHLVARREFETRPECPVLDEADSEDEEDDEQ